MVRAARSLARDTTPLTSLEHELAHTAQLPTLWMVLHDHGGGVSGWVRRAQRGDCVALWGPRTALAPPADTRSFLLVVDETPLPTRSATAE